MTTKKGTPKKDGSGRGTRSNRGRGDARQPSGRDRVAAGAEVKTGSKYDATQ